MLYLQHTRTILDDLDHANLSLKLELDQPQGKLRITFAHSFGSKALAPLLAEFAEKYPKIQLEVYGSDEYIDLAAERFDLAVRLGKVDDPNLIAKRIAPQKRLLCASPSYLARKTAPKMPEDLQQHNCLLYSYRGYTQKWHFRQAGEAAKAVSVKGNLLGNNTEILREYALAGIGIAHLPNWLIADELANGTLVSVPPEWQVQPSNNDTDDAIYLAYPPNSRQIVKINVLVQFLGEGWEDRRDRVYPCPNFTHEIQTKRTGIKPILTICTFLFEFDCLTVRTVQNDQHLLHNLFNKTRLIKPK